MKISMATISSATGGGDDCGVGEEVVFWGMVVITSVAGCEMGFTDIVLLFLVQTCAVVSHAPSRYVPVLVIAVTLKETLPRPVASNIPFENIWIVSLGLVVVALATRPCMVMFTVGRIVLFAIAAVLFVLF